MIRVWVGDTEPAEVTFFNYFFCLKKNQFFFLTDAICLTGVLSFAGILHNYIILPGKKYFPTNMTGLWRKFIYCGGKISIFQYIRNHAG